MTQLPPTTPADVGLNTSTLETAFGHLQTALDAGAISAAALEVTRHGKRVFRRAAGHLRPDSVSPELSDDAVFLVASITKPVTVCALMQLVETGDVGLEDAVVKHLSEFTGGERGEVLVRHLLSHTSGLPDMLPENGALRERHAPLKEFVQGALKTPLLYRPGKSFDYQSMGTLLAAEIVERKTGHSLPDVFEQKIFQPLGMTRSSLGIRGRKIEDTVWCGTTYPEESESGKRYGANTAYWRNIGNPWGGLHTTTGDLALLLEAFLEGGALGDQRILREDTVKEMLRDQNEGLNAPWGLGWALAGSKVWNDMGQHVSPSTFGHSGATGTVAWADPTRHLACVVLNNLRVEDGALLRRVSDAVGAAVVSDP